ncbi:MAG: hypothetical protein K2X52_09120 [Mycobacteriaceae bacterium]|nr:hypothetical protein [Mycobacteriaceae bacterium]
MDSEDVVEPIDALLQELLAAVAERTADSARRDAIMDHILTVPPVREWPAESLEQLMDACEYVKRLAHEMRQNRRER